MKTKLVKSMMTPLVIAYALLPLLAATASGQGTQGGRIQGMWEQITTLTDCAGHPIRSFPVMLTFHQGGTIMDGTTTPPALRTPGQGVWEHVSDNTYAFRFCRHKNSSCDPTVSARAHARGMSRGKQLVPEQIGKNQPQRS